MKRLCLLMLVLAAAPATAQDMPLSQILKPGAGWQQVPLMSRSSGGLAADKDGNVYVSDPESKRIIRIDKDGNPSLFASTTTAVHGLAIDAEGRLLGCEPEKGQICVIDKPEKETVLYDGLKGVQDLVVTRMGRMYCSVPGEHAVYLLERDGKKQVVERGLHKPTGLALWADHGTLLVADAEDKYLWTYRIEKDGSLSAGERYFPLRVRPKEVSSAMGLTMDAAGRAYVASQEGVQVFDPTGRLCGLLLKPSAEPLVAVAFGGKERDMLYLACGHKLFVRQTLAKGVSAAKGK